MKLVETIGNLASVCCDKDVVLTIQRGIITLCYGYIMDKQYIAACHTDSGAILKMINIVNEL